MKDSSDPSHDLEDDILDDGSGDTEANQRLINQLKSRIVELEMRGDHLMNEKEQLEVRRRGRGGGGGGGGGRDVVISYSNECITH